MPVSVRPVGKDSLVRSTRTSADRRHVRMALLVSISLLGSSAIVLSDSLVIYSKFISFKLNITTLCNMSYLM